MFTRRLNYNYNIHHVTDNDRVVNNRHAFFSDSLNMPGIRHTPDRYIKKSLRLFLSAFNIHSSEDSRPIIIVDFNYKTLYYVVPGCVFCTPYFKDLVVTKWQPLIITTFKNNVAVCRIHPYIGRRNKMERKINEIVFKYMMVHQVNIEYTIELYKDLLFNYAIEDGNLEEARNIVREVINYYYGVSSE